MTHNHRRISRRIHSNSHNSRRKLPTTRRVTINCTQKTYNNSNTRPTLSSRMYQTRSQHRNRSNFNHSHRPINNRRTPTIRMTNRSTLNTTTRVHLNNNSNQNSRSNSNSRRIRRISTRVLLGLHRIHNHLHTSTTRNMSRQLRPNLTRQNRHLIQINRRNVTPKNMKHMIIKERRPNTKVRTSRRHIIRRNLLIQRILLPMTRRKLTKLSHRRNSPKHNSTIRLTLQTSRHPRSILSPLSLILFQNKCRRRRPVIQRLYSPPTQNIARHLHIRVIQVRRRRIPKRKDHTTHKQAHLIHGNKGPLRHMSLLNRSRPTLTFLQSRPLTHRNQVPILLVLKRPKIRPSNTNPTHHNPYLPNLNLIRNLTHHRPHMSSHPSNRSRNKRARTMSRPKHRADQRIPLRQHRRQQAKHHHRPSRVHRSSRHRRRNRCTNHRHRHRTRVQHVIMRNRRSHRPRRRSRYRNRNLTSINTSVAHSSTPVKITLRALRNVPFSIRRHRRTHRRHTRRSHRLGTRPRQLTSRPPHMQNHMINLSNRLMPINTRPVNRHPNDIQITMRMMITTQVLSQGPIRKRCHHTRQADRPQMTINRPANQFPQSIPSNRVRNPHTTQVPSILRRFSSINAHITNHTFGPHGNQHAKHKQH